jgi:hypothetical protein
MDPLADQRQVVGDRERGPVVEHDHRQALGHRVHPERDRRRRGRAQDVRLADQAEEVGDVPAAGALDVIGVDGPAGDRRDRVLELGRLVEAVGVERDRHVVGVGEAQDVVDQLRVGAVVLVDLEAAGAGVEERLERTVVLRPGAGLQPHVDRPVGESQQRPFHLPGRLLEPGGHQGRHTP